MQIHIFDGKQIPDPQNMAMLQALYSRSNDSVIKQLEVNRNASKFMDRYVVKYGHGSIAQCGYITLFCENVSMFLAKLIQFHNYYVGQETSSRYIDFSAGEAVYETDTEKQNQEFLFNTYRTVLEVNKDKIAVYNFGKTYIECSKEEQNAINPRAFDLSRGYLPFGAKTNVSWVTNFDNLWKHLSWMKAHFPNKEVLEFVNSVLDFVQENYPDSIPALLGEDGTGASRDNMGNRAAGILRYPFADSVTAFGNRLLNIISFNSTIDLGSWRDIQRHRNTIQSWPSLTKTFNDYYVIPDFKFDYKPTSWFDTPLGMNIEYAMSMRQDQFEYIISARSKETVHYTLRQDVAVIINKINQGIAIMDKNNILCFDLFKMKDKHEAILIELKKSLILSRYRISLKRAAQTIEEKK